MIKNLKVNQPLDFISPTGFMQAIDCELAFYFYRMSGLELPRDPQTKPMAVGSAFDSFVKAEIARLLGKTNESKNLLAELLKSCSYPDCIAIGKNLFDQYNYWGCLKQLMDDGLTDIELTSASPEAGMGSFKEICGIPIFAKPDATISSRVPATGIYSDGTLVNGTMIKQIPTDWKVNGALSKTGQSPKQGYLRAYVEGVDQGRHPKFGCPLEEIDEKWATQLLIYYLVLNPYDLSNIRVAIEQLAIRGPKLVIAQFRTNISEGWAFRKIEELKSVWGRLKEGQIDMPQANKWRCEPYGNPRGCTSICPLYKNMEEPNR